MQDSFILLTNNVICCKGSWVTCCTCLT